MARPPKYPWHVWLASPDPVHVDCNDYDVSPHSFRIQALQKARSEKLPVSTAACRSHPKCIVLAPAPKPKRNWSELLNGRPHNIWYSELGRIQPESFIRTAREQAKKRGLSLEVNRTYSELGMVITAVEKRIPTRPSSFNDRKVRYL